MDPTSRLRLATRIHFALLRQYGETVAVRDLLDGAREGREALWVCAASGDAELATLARELGRANRRGSADKGNAYAPASVRPAGRQETPSPQSGGRVPQDTAWAQDTSGFGATRPAPLSARPRRAAGAAPSWFAPMDWLRRNTEKR